MYKTTDIINILAPGEEAVCLTEDSPVSSIYCDLSGNIRRKDTDTLLEMSYDIKPLMWKRVVCKVSFEEAASTLRLGVPVRCWDSRYSTPTEYVLRNGVVYESMVGTDTEFKSGYLNWENALNYNWYVVNR